jgi:hypothetical protein
MDILIELDQNSFIGNMDAINFTDSRGAVVVANALASICGDGTGKEAINELKIKKIILKNVPKGTARKFEIKDGIFWLIHAFDADGLPGYYDEGDLRKALENSL